jgi:hypothetical protein
MKLPLYVEDTLTMQGQHKLLQAELIKFILLFHFGHADLLLLIFYFIFMKKF